MKVDLETLKAIKELMVQPNQHMGQVVPIAPTREKDSFISFTDGLRSNWIFVMALVAGGMWLINSANAQQRINDFQNTEIESSIEDIAQNTADIKKLDVNMQTLNATQVANYNDIIRRMDALQASIENLKNEE